MSGKRIYRLNIDDYNDTGRSKNVFLKANLQQELINSQDAPNYNVAIEKAEFSISAVPMFVNKGDLKVNFYTIGSGDTPVRVHTLEGNYLSIPEFIDDLNSKMEYKAGLDPEPITNGKFHYDHETELITFTMTADESERFVQWDEIIGFSPQLVFLLDFFGGFLSSTGRIQNIVRNQINTFTQQRSTRSRFYQMKAIRIYSPSLNTNPYFVYDQNTSTLVQTNMLSEIILNSEFMDSGNINVIYIPTQFRFSEIISSGINVQNIIIYATVHYATGDDIPLVCLPGEYTSLTLVFEKVL